MSGLARSRGPDPRYWSSSVNPLPARVAPWVVVPIGTAVGCKDRRGAAGHPAHVGHVDDRLRVPEAAQWYAASDLCSSGPDPLEGYSSPIPCVAYPMSATSLAFPAALFVHRTGIESRTSAPPFPRATLPAVNFTPLVTHHLLSNSCVAMRATKV